MFKKPYLEKYPHILRRFDVRNIILLTENGHFGGRKKLFHYCSPCLKSKRILKASHRFCRQQAGMPYYYFIKYTWLLQPRQRRNVYIILSCEPYFILCNRVVNSNDYSIIIENACRIVKYPCGKFLKININNQGSELFVVITLKYLHTR